MEKHKLRFALISNVVVLGATIYLIKITGSGRWILLFIGCFYTLSKSENKE